MSTNGFRQIISADSADREDLFLTTALRLGAPLINIEKDFWVCWTLNTLYNRLPNDGPRLLFKGDCGPQIFSSSLGSYDLIVVMKPTKYWRCYNSIIRFDISR